MKLALSSTVVLVITGVSILCPVSSVDAQPVQLRRGDADLNGAIELTDAVRILSFLFLGSPLDTCLPAADADENGARELTDAVSILSHLFLGAPAPEPLSGFENRVCQEPDGESVGQGEVIYSTLPPDSVSNYEFSCSTCHDNVPLAEMTFRRAGHTLYDAVRRPNFKNGRVADFLGAANVCRVDWMIAPEWTDDNEDFQDLVSYLHSLSPVEPAPAHVFEVSAPTTEGPSNGDASAGCGLFHNSCSRCHGENGAGSSTGPQIIFLEIGEALFQADFIREKVRMSGPVGSVYDDLLGGQMPFWTTAQLSDAELEDIVAYLMQDEPAPCPE
jgi:cytochrome c553